VSRPGLLLRVSTLLVLGVFGWLWPARATAEPLRRTAVIVGANAAAPGRKPLRYSEHDARALAGVLIELGGFAREDVHVLIDPEPNEVLATLDQALARPGADASLLVFYYSGHADTVALYPRGRPLSFADLRTRLGDRRASIRLGIIDACRGGGFTGAKGLTEVAPFEVTLPMALESEGSILIASSSGLEDAHESEQLGGSFFTHHWNAGLRGAGDRNADGQVTLQEAFDYAKTLTIRDSMLQTSAAQHPSFSLNLRGRQDLALSKLTGAKAIVAVDQREGPLELVHLDTGVVMLELPRGPRNMRLAVAPGDYLLRRRRAGELWTRELTVEAGNTMRVDEASLELHGAGALAIKRSAPRPLTLTTLPRGMQEGTFALGVSHTDRPGVRNVGRDFTTGAYFPRGLTDRWQMVLPAPALTYRGGEHAGLEWIPSAGVVGLGMGVSSLEGFVLELIPGASFELRKWLSARSSITVGVGTWSRFRYHSKDSSGAIFHEEGQPVRARPKREPPDTWRGRLEAGITHTLGDTVTLHFSVSVAQTLISDGEPGPFAPQSERGGLTLGFGAVQQVGLRPQHLLQVHVTDHVALNLDAALHYGFAHNTVQETYLAGASFLW
jgi:hypothetical protein